MKISAKTLEILGNFATINLNLRINPGQKLSTASSSMDILAVANVDEKDDVFPVKVCIFDLNLFLGTIRLFKSREPDFTFADSYVDISNGNTNVRFIYADPATVAKTTPKHDNGIKNMQDKFSLNLTAGQLNELRKASNMLSLPDLALKSDGTKIIALLTDASNSSSNQYTIDIGPCDKVFDCRFAVNRLNLLDDDYVVTLGSVSNGEETAPIAKFVGTKYPVTYWVSMLTDTTY